MAILLRLVGCVWLILVFAGLVITYGLMWIWQGVMTATATPPASAPVGLLGVAALALPGLLMIGLALWLDRRR